MINPKVRSYLSTFVSSNNFFISLSLTNLFWLHHCA